MILLAVKASPKTYLVKWPEASMKVSSLAHAAKLMGILQVQDPTIIVSISLVK